MSHHTSPIVRRAETGCFATLSTSLVPSSITHNAAGCKCILAARRADKETIARMATNVRYALATGVFESDKPAVDFAMLLLGATLFTQI